MRSKAYLGEFEQLVLLVIVGEDNDVASNDISRALEESADRPVSRGALYTTLDRLRKKGMLEWRVEPGDMARSGLPRRHFTVTAQGMRTLSASRDVLMGLWLKADDALGRAR